MCCSVLQCVAVCCSVLQCVGKIPQLRTATVDSELLCCSLLHYVAACYSVLRCAGQDTLSPHCSRKKTRCSVLKCVALCRSVLQCGAMYCSVLQCVAVCCNVLQCVAVCCRERARYLDFTPQQQTLFQRFHSPHRVPHLILHYPSCKPTHLRNMCTYI